MLEVIFLSVVGGVFSLAGGALLLIKKKTADGMAIYATPFAAGVMLAAAFTDLLPEAIKESSDTNNVLVMTLYGFLGFFVLERLVRWFNHRNGHPSAKKGAMNSLVMIGDTLHNGLDGVAIAVSLLISPQIGIVTTIAVAAHEIPQEIGDFGIMLKNGMSRPRVLLFNFFSALATVFTAVVTYSLGNNSWFPGPSLLAITAGFFIYISASDLIPEIHEKIEGNRWDIRPLLLLLGVLFIIIFMVVTKA